MWRDHQFAKVVKLQGSAKVKTSHKWYTNPSKSHATEGLRFHQGQRHPWSPVQPESHFGIIPATSSNWLTAVNRFLGWPAWRGRCRGSKPSASTWLDDRLWRHGGHSRAGPRDVSGWSWGWGKTQDPIMLVAWTCMNYCIKTWCSIFLFTFLGGIPSFDPWHLGCTEHSAPIILQIWWFRFNPSLNHNLIIIFKYKLVVWCILRFLRYPLFSDTHRSICLALRRKKNRSNVRCLSRWTMSASASAWWTCPLVRLGWKLVSGPQICIPGIVQEWLVTGW